MTHSAVLFNSLLGTLNAREALRTDHLGDLVSIHLSDVRFAVPTDQISIAASSRLGDVRGFTFLSAAY